MCEIPPADGKPICLLLSGGLDSCILLGQMIAHGHRVQPVYIASDLVWQAAELAALRGLLAAMQTAALAPLVVLKLPLEDIYQDHWSLTGAEIPGAESPDEAVYLPGRNALLLIKAALWCHRRGIERVALGVLGTSPFADAKSAFFDHFQAAINLATGARIEFLRPLARATKQDVMRLGRTMPLERTFSCLAPHVGLHCGVCNKCTERRRAFQVAEIPDRTVYQSDPVSAG
jgi:7-cyano-7-deazaguanine synthase